jgi:hypothetical protein
MKPDSGAPAKPDMVTPLCDGTEALKLRLYHRSAGNEERASIVRVENGLPSIGIDGQCNYYISGGWFENRNSRVLGWRKGKIDKTLEATLSETFQPSQLSSLAGCESSDGMFDVAPMIIASPTSRASCIVPGQAFKAAWAVIESRATALWEAAKPMAMDGPIWLLGATTSDTLPAYDWPLSEPLSMFLIPDTGPGAGTLDLMSGVAHRVADPKAASQLRELRERFLTDAEREPVNYIDSVKVTDGQIPARVYMRDALPFEDEHGLWPEWAR